MLILKLEENESLMDGVKELAHVLRKNEPYMFIVDSNFYRTALDDYWDVANLLLEEMENNDNMVIVPASKETLLWNLRRYHKKAKKMYSRSDEYTVPVDEVLEYLATLYNFAVALGAHEEEE